MRKEILSERAELFDPNIYVLMTFDIVGGADVQLLIEAAKRAFTRFESPMSKIVLTDTGRAYYERMLSSGCTVQSTQSDFNDLIRTLERQRFAIENGELVKVFFRQTSDKVRVLVMSHHLAGDGKSIVYFIERMMKEYIGEQGEYMPLKLLNEDNLPSDSHISRLYSLMINSYKPSWAKSGRVFDWDDMDKLHDTYWKDRESVILSKQLSPECADKIHANAKAANVSVNSWILTAFMKANRRYKNVGLSVDARTDKNRTMSNQTTGFTTRFTYNDRLNFAQNARRLHLRIYKKLNNPTSRYFILHFVQLFTPPFIDSILMNVNGVFDNKISKKAAIMMGYGPFRRNGLSVSNLTKLDIADAYGNLRIENFSFVPPVISYTYQTFGIATTSSGMTITFHSMNDRFNDGERQMFFDAISILEK